MKRRKAIRNIVLFSLGTGIIYSCKDKYAAIKQLNLKHLLADPLQLDIIDDLSRSIVPLQNIPELAEHTALPFIMNMVDDVYKQEDRDLFIEGYQTFETEVLAITGKNYKDLLPEEKQCLLSELNDESIVPSPALSTLFKTVKDKSIQYLTSSEYYQRKVNYYEMAPGRFKGDVLLSELKNMNDE